MNGGRGRNWRNPARRPDSSSPRQSFVWSEQLFRTATSRCCTPHCDFIQRGVASAPLLVEPDLGGSVVIHDVPGPTLQRMYEAFVASIDGVVWEGDVESRQLTFVSPEAERMLGYPLATWLISGFWAQHLHPDDREWAIESRARAAAARGGTELEYRMLDAQGRTVWVRDLVSVGEDSHAPKLCGVMIDVTERKQSEDERRA